MADSHQALKSPLRLSTRILTAYYLHIQTRSGASTGFYTAFCDTSVKIGGNISNSMLIKMEGGGIVDSFPFLRKIKFKHEKNIHQKYINQHPYVQHTTLF